LEWDTLTGLCNNYPVIYTKYLTLKLINILTVFMSLLLILLRLTEMGLHLNIQRLNRGQKVSSFGKGYLNWTCGNIMLSSTFKYLTVTLVSIIGVFMPFF